MRSQYQALARFSSSRLPLASIVRMTGLGTLVKREKSFLLYQQKYGVYLYFKDYGGMAAIGLDEQSMDVIIERLNKECSVEVSAFTESITVKVGSHAVEQYDEINIDELTIETAHIICLNLAQSVALFYYQSNSDKLLADTRVYTNELERKGKVSLKRKELMKYIGSTLNLKNKISENLYVFDTPMLAYEHEDINAIDAHLNEELEIKYRYNAIKEQLNIIQENLELFKDMNMHQHSSNLEWIIIWLILFEVIHVIIDQIF